MKVLAVIGIILLSLLLATCAVVFVTAIWYVWCVLLPEVWREMKFKRARKRRDDTTRVELTSPREHRMQPAGDQS